MPLQSLPDRSTPDDYAVADRAIVVAQAALWLAQVEAVCLRTCNPAHCRVRGSLKRSLDAEREQLALLRHDLLHDHAADSLHELDPIGTNYQVAS